MRRDRIGVFVYGLRDPRTGEIRYVGQSRQGMERPKSHLHPSKLKFDTYKTRWLRKLIAIGLRPEIVVLQSVIPDGDLDSIELEWIALGRAALGERFTNQRIGGNSSPIGDEQREKLRKAAAQAWQSRSPEAIERRRLAKVRGHLRRKC